MVWKDDSLITKVVAQFKGSVEKICVRLPLS